MEGSTHIHTNANIHTHTYIHIYIHSVKGPEIINMYIGQSEENIREGRPHPPSCRLT